MRLTTAKTVDRGASHITFLTATRTLKITWPVRRLDGPVDNISFVQDSSRYFELVGKQALRRSSHGCRRAGQVIVKVRVAVEKIMCDASRSTVFVVVSRIRAGSNDAWQAKHLLYVLAKPGIEIFDDPAINVISDFVDWPEVF
jgi:hypothetical protein